MLDKINFRVLQSFHYYCLVSCFDLCLLQVDFANRQLREQKYLSDNIKDVRHRETLYTRVPETRQDTSTDSLELELNDSLNPNG